MRSWKCWLKYSNLNKWLNNTTRKNYIKYHIIIKSIYYLINSQRTILMLILSKDTDIINWESLGDSELRSIQLHQNTQVSPFNRKCISPTSLLSHSCEVPQVRLQRKNSFSLSTMAKAHGSSLLQSAVEELKKEELIFLKNNILLSKKHNAN